MGARLWGWWGSSAAQGTAYPETFPDFRRGGTLGRPGVSGPCIRSCSPVGATLAVARPRPARRGQEAVPYRGGETSKAAGHSPVLQVLPGLGRGRPLGLPPGGMPRKHPHPPPSGAPSPLEGEGLSGRVWDPPLQRITKTVSLLRRGRSQTGPPGFAPKALARQSQAQRLNRTSRNFCTPRAQWPGGNSDQPLRFCTPELLLNFSGGTPVKGVRGKANMSAKRSS